MEIDAQTATLEEQRNHIAVLDKALSNAQDRLGKSNRVGAEFLEKKWYKMGIFRPTKS